MLTVASRANAEWLIKETKAAAASCLYHMAPSAAREKIEREGLIAHDDLYPDESQGGDHQDVWLTDKQLTPSPNNDVWRVHGLQPHLDAEYDPSEYEDEGTGKWYRTPLVEPHRLERIAKVGELHVGLGIPKPIAIEIHNWAEEQDWPEGTELEPIEEYHVTMLYSPEGHSHKDDPWMDHESHAVSIKGIKAFPSKEREDKDAIVLTVDSETIGIHHNELAHGAEDAGIEISPYSFDDFKPHMTIAYGSLPPKLKPPKLTFETEPSSVSPPREEQDGTEKKSWRVHDARAPYEAELLKFADSWNPKDQWPNALRERSSEPTGVDCTCKDGHKLDCPVHGMHPTLPTYDDALEFRDPSSPVGYDYHTEAPRTWMRAETKVAAMTPEEMADEGYSPFEIDMIAKLHEHPKQWTPGTRGKAYVTSEGQAYEWSVEPQEEGQPAFMGGPHHGLVEEQLGGAQLGNNMLEPSAGLKLDIHPNGVGEPVIGDDALTAYFDHPLVKPKEKSDWKFQRKRDEEPEAYTGINLGLRADDDEGANRWIPRIGGKKKLWLDDTRRPPDDSWDWARDAREAKKLTKQNDYKHMSLDHDLGIIRYEGKVVINPDALSGGDFVVWLHEHRKHMPKSVNIHSHNGKSVDLMKKFLEKHTDVTTDRAPDELEESWAREFKIHEPSEIEKEEVRLPEHTASHQLAWLPGSGIPGKGLVTPNGDVHTWPVDKRGIPHHAEYVDQRQPYQLGEGTAHFFQIRPRGGLDTKGYSIPANIINHVLQTVPSLRAGEHTDWHFGADQWDTREYPDARMMPPTTMQEPAQSNPHPEKQGCTCDQGHKLDCPVHGLNPTEDGFDHSWSIPQGHPVGYPQDQPRNYMKAEGSAEDASDEHDAQAHKQTEERGTKQSADNRREGNQENSVGIDHQYSVACDCPGCVHRREHSWHIQSPGTSGEGWSGLPRAEGAVDDEDEHADNLEGGNVAPPAPPIEIRKKRKEQEDEELVRESLR